MAYFIVSFIVLIVILVLARWIFDIKIIIWHLRYQSNQLKIIAKLEEKRALKDEVVTHAELFDIQKAPKQ